MKEVGEDLPQTTWLMNDGMHIEIGIKGKEERCHSLIH